jgi:protein-L-isoaspartate(D-aspartate) O-methyltransferase
VRVALISAFIIFAGTPAFQNDRFSTLRKEMVDNQIVARGITDRKTIEAIRKVPRHLFVPWNLQNQSYDDTPLPIGYGQTISQPYIVALMTEAVKPAPGKKALEIGTGSGYQAAVLAQIVDTVYSIEIVPELARESAERFRQLGYGNIISKHGDGYRGWPEHAPYDIIVVTAAPDEIPPPLISQLAEGGRLIIPVGSSYTFQDLILATKRNGKVTERRLTTVRFVPFRRSWF